MLLQRGQSEGATARAVSYKESDSFYFQAFPLPVASIFVEVVLNETGVPGLQVACGQDLQRCVQRLTQKLPL